MEFNKGFFYNWRKRDLIKSTSTLLSLLLFNLLRVGMENLKSNGADSKKKKKKRFVNAIFFFFLFWRRRKKSMFNLRPGSWKVSPRPDSIAINFGLYSPVRAARRLVVYDRNETCGDPLFQKTNQIPEELPRERLSLSLSLHDLVNLTWRFMRDLLNGGDISFREADGEFEMFSVFAKVSSWSKLSSIIKTEITIVVSGFK